MSKLEQSILNRSLSQRADFAAGRPASPSTSDELDLSDEKQSESIVASHRGAQTGVKGVRADAAHHGMLARERQAEEIKATNARMEAMALSKTRTWKEDDAERKREMELGIKPAQKTVESDEEELTELRNRRLQNLKSQAAANESRRKRMAGEEGQHRPARCAFGHLREVGPEQYAQAIDGEDASTYIVVHIYVKYVHACAMLTSALSSLARMHPKTKFLQVRAGSIGFGSGGKHDGDADDLDEEAEEIVPTLLVYKAGNIVANLVRIDMDEGWGDGSERCVREILHGYNALH